MTITDAGIYGGGPLYTGGQARMDQLRSSGMTTIIAWSVHVTTSGELVYNDTPIVSDGAYVGDPEWPARLATLKTAPTSVQRLIFSVGAGGTDDFTHIQQLGTAPGGILQRNFQALRQRIPTIDAIDFDDEDLYDHKTIVDFAKMLHGLGFEVTFCPYTDSQFWTGCLKALNGQTPNLVTRFNLQCYSGGEGNDPKQWIKAIQDVMGPLFDAAGFVYPGLWCRHKDNSDPAGDCPAQIKDTFAGWMPDKIRGGWIWLLDDVLRYEHSGLCSGPMGVAAYAKAIDQGLHS